ncbi:MAG: hypothetical protein ACLUDF_01235 [Butyricicoccus sp.]
MTWEYEEKAWANGYDSVCGVDEAGRGPVAGPVCAAAVMPAESSSRLNDSKKLSERSVRSCSTKSRKTRLRGRFRSWTSG